MVQTTKDGATMGATVKSKVTTTTAVVAGDELAQLRAERDAAIARANAAETAMKSGRRLDGWYDEDARSWTATSGKNKGQKVSNRWQGYQIIGEGTVRLSCVIGPQGGLKIETADPITGWGHGGIRVDADNAQPILDFLADGLADVIQKAIDTGKMAG
jgi:hypothetical protein